MPVPMPIIRWFLKFAESEINLLKGWKTGVHQIFEAIEKTTDNGKLARPGGGWFIITSEGNTVEDWTETGRKFERLAN